MPKPAKPLDNLSGHLTKAERAIREEAEKGVIPDRAVSALAADKYPKSLSGDTAARNYWRDTIRRMEGLVILDDLDIDTLAVYCSTLSRRDALNKLCNQLIRDSRKDKATAETQLEKVSQLDTLLTKVLKHESQILQYADKLGLTPVGRVRLARKRAEAAEVGDDDDLFGD